MHELYGEDYYSADDPYRNDVEMSDLYGDDGQGEADVSDVYGYERPDIEPER